jgi:hypothetical protein
VPSCHTMRSFGANVVTRSLNVRSGVMVARSSIVSPAAIFPWMLWTVEFHRGKSCAFVSNAQMALAAACTVIPTETLIRNALWVMMAFPSV